jgi:ADP-ribose pyrophosphatase YjhB (NUDIX family)
MTVYIVENITHDDMSDNTDPIAQQLRAYHAQFPEETATIEATQHFLNVREKQETHDSLTGSAWIFNPHSGKIMIMHNKKMDCWTQVGGHTELKSQESIQTAALREATELSGLKHLQLYSEELFHLTIQLSSHAEKQHHIYNFCYLFYTHETSGQTENETEAMRWISPSDIARFSTYRAIHAVAKKWQLFCYEKEPIA